MAIVVVGGAAYIFYGQITGGGPTSTSSTTHSSAKSVILYVNQGNGKVNDTNFASMVDFAIGKGFNTVFFQVYRGGELLFTQGQLGSFVLTSHQSGLKIYFSLYITAPSQPLPSLIYGIGEDGISLDMSGLTTASQESFLNALKGSYSGSTAVTTTNMTSSLHPDLLVLETYQSSLQSFIAPGSVGSVGVFATTSKQDYQARFMYAYTHSDGVMVFDYAGLVKSGY